jgi:hypothetical protein
MMGWQAESRYDTVILADHTSSTAGWCGVITAIGSALVASACFVESGLRSATWFGEPPTRRDLQLATDARVVGAVALGVAVVLVAAVVVAVRALARHGHRTKWLPLSLIAGWAAGLAIVLAIIGSNSVSDHDKVIASAVAWFTTGALIGPLLGCLLVWRHRSDNTMTSVAR